MYRNLIQKPKIWTFDSIYYFKLCVVKLFMSINTLDSILIYYISVAFINIILLKFETKLIKLIESVNSYSSL